MRSNLLSLQKTQNLMDATQNRLSTGNKVNSAIDNPSNYYTARSLTNRANDLSSLLDSMGQAISTIKAATEALDSGLTFLEQATAIASQATSEAQVVPMKDRVKLENNAAELIAQGYVEVNSSTTIEEFRTLVNTAGTKIVLTEDVDFGSNYINIAADVEINGAGHTLVIDRMIDSSGANNLKISNMNIESTHQSGRTIIMVSGLNTLISNVRITKNILGTGEAGGIQIKDGKVENVSIDLLNDQYRDVQGVDVVGNAELSGVTINISAAPDATVTGIATSNSSATINLDGVSIQTSGGSEVIGIDNTRGGTITGLPAGVSGAKISVEDVNNAFAELSDDSFKNQYNEVLAQYNSIVNDASYKGVNLLKDGALDVKFSDSSSSSLQIKGQDISTSNIGLNAAEWKNHDDINNSLSELRAAISNLRSFSSELGNNYSIVQNREDFTKSLINVLTEGADKLTLADMNEESANMLALQTRQQLAINSLSLASQASQSVLKLF